MVGGLGADMRAREEEEGVGKELGDGCLALLELDHLCLLVHVDNMVERQLEANLLSHNLT